MAISQSLSNSMQSIARSTEDANELIGLLNSVGQSPGGAREVDVITANFSTTPTTGFLLVDPSANAILITFTDDAVVGQEIDLRIVANGNVTMTFGISESLVDPYSAGLTLTKGGGYSAKFVFTGTYWAVINETAL